MNQHLMAEVNFMAPGEKEEGTGGEYECPDSKVPAWFNNSTFWANIQISLSESQCLNSMLSSERAVNVETLLPLLSVSVSVISRLITECF